MFENAFKEYMKTKPNQFKYGNGMDLTPEYTKWRYHAYDLLRARAVELSFALWTESMPHRTMAVDLVKLSACNLKMGWDETIFNEAANEVQEMENWGISKAVHLEILYQVLLEGKVMPEYKYPLRRYYKAI